MMRLLAHLTVALVAFVIGATAAHLFPYSRSQGEASVTILDVPAMLPPEQAHAIGEPSDLSPEEAEVVTQAEYFVCWNGYTHQGCGGTGKIYFEPGENPDDLDRIWPRRRDTLEGRAYGLLRTEEGSSTFWTVVFRYTEGAGKRREKYGRAYVVEDDHGPFARRYFVRFYRDFPLEKVAKRL